MRSCWQSGVLMVYIYIELRYQRQLNRICPDVPAAFFSAVAESVRKNGGTVHRCVNGFLYQFDNSSIGFAFASARAIGYLQKLLEQNRNRIREYFILVDYSEKDIPVDNFRERLSVYENIITPDEGILVTESARECLQSYIDSVRLPETSLYMYSGLSFAENTDQGQKSAEMPIVPVLYTAYADDPVSALINLICTLPYKEPPQGLTEEESSLYAESRNALEVYKRFRFSSNQPAYRIAACVDCLSFVLRSVCSSSGKPLSVRVYGSDQLSGGWTQVMDKLSQTCRFDLAESPVFLAADLKSLPDDLADLAYLLHLAVSFLYLDELPSFFQSLGKESDFIDALGNWLYSAGILSDQKDFRSFNPALSSPIKKRVGERKNVLDGKLASFLWKQYESGKIEPVFPLCAILDDLKFDVPDNFLVSCLYHENDPLHALKSIYPRFKNRQIPETIEMLELARAKYEQGKFEESGILAKNILQVFQNERILAGEYRTLSLIAMLSLVRNNADDSVVYLEYALENAERMHDSYAILCTRFDMVMVYFLIGNLHFSLCGMDSVEKIIESCYAKDWEVLLLFMKGRISFELGDYRNAELLFQTAASLASVHQIPESVSLCRVWYARSLVHQGRYASAESILAECAVAISDSWLFLLESAIISGREMPNMEFPDKFPVASDHTARLMHEKFSWKSGFSIAEDRCFGVASETSIPARMYEAFSLYYRARFVKDSDMNDTVDSLSLIARIALEAKDPYASIYYYFCYDLGIKSDKILPADTAGFLSRGFKYMQCRANEIGDNSMREHFMQVPSWNSRLYRAARDNMLI